MRLESVTLDNIRSYTEPTTIPLPPGSTLFQGDIGSGKSSILSAIEFALFGLGDVDGRYLLNSRAKRGSVLLEFRVGDQSYKVHRELQRNKNSVIQMGGYIVEGERRTEYAVTGMRARILEIIGIRERQQAKTTSLIYRSAVFSPQEMMKEILTENAERRLDTLRRAFGIEDYSNAKKNTELVDRWAAEEVRYGAKFTNDLSQKRQALGKEEATLAKLSSDLDPLTSRLGELEQSMTAVEGRLADLKGQRDSVLQLEVSIPSIQGRVADMKSALAEERRRVSKAKEELSELARIEKQLGELGQRFDAYKHEKEELEKLEPTSEDYAKKEIEKQRLRTSLNEKTQRLQQEVDELKGAIDKDDAELQEDLREVEPLESLRTRMTKLDDSVSTIERVRKTTEQLEKRLEALRVEKLPLENEIKSSKSELEGITAIGVGAPCPKCRRPLDEKHLRDLTKRLKAEVTGKRKQAAVIQAKLSKTTLESRTLKAQLATMEKDEKELRELKPRVSALEVKARASFKAHSKLDDKKEKLAKLEERLRKKDFGGDERAQLEPIEKFLREQGPAVARYKELRRSVQAAEKEQIHSVYLTAAEKHRRKPQLEEEIRGGEERLASSQQSLLKQEQELEEKRAEYSAKKSVLKDLSLLEKEQQRLRSEHDETDRKLAVITANIDSAREHITTISQEVRGMEQTERRKAYFEQVRVWLDTCFAPAVDDIERSTLTSVNEQFNQEFQKWFRILIETEDMEVEVDQSFTPVVTQGGYSLEVNSLSGGERTSVALAYRLALNVTARAALGLEPDLLILDEPTDGFSSAQLTKLNQVLDGLGPAQVIMVSHETELETYVNHIYRVTKDGGVSKVEFVKQ